MSDNKKIRVPATTVELIQILGNILRDHIKLGIIGSECWTFEHVRDWEIYGEKPDSDADVVEWDLYLLHGNPEHRMSVYFGSGNCHVVGPDGKTELRVCCEHRDWIPASINYWDVQVWIKSPNQPIARHHYQCFHHGRWLRDVCLVKNSKMRQRPPKKIAFWRKDPEKLFYKIAEPTEGA